MIEQIKALTEKGLYSAITATEMKALKKSRITKEATPENLSVITKYSFQILSLGHTYQDLINQRLVKESKYDSFQSDETYVEKVENTLCLYTHKTKEQLYLRAFPLLGQYGKIKSVYVDADGNIIPEEMMTDLISHYFAIPKNNAHQGGLENKVELKNYKIEGILYLKRKDLEIISENLTDKILNLLIEH